MSNRKNKVFIASSSRAKKLATALAKLLEGDPAARIEAEAWFDSDSYDSKSILGHLISKANEYDFAAVLLTKDDRLIRSDDPATIRDAPRDNCVFELGLFLGALGPGRCFPITSLPEDKALPVDLRGHLYLPFAEPDAAGLLDDARCEEAVKPICEQIVNSINGAGVFSRPQLPYVSLEDLIEMERKTSVGSEVVVHAPKPLETKYKYAEDVFRNMERGVKYHYYFDDSPFGAHKIIELIRTLALVDGDGRLLGGVDWDDEALPDRARIDILSKKDNRDTILSNLDSLRTRLKIHILPYNASEAFCMHNAGDDTRRATCFLRWDQGNFLTLTDPLTTDAKYKFYRGLRLEPRRNEAPGLIVRTKYYQKEKWKSAVKRMNLRGAIHEKFPTQTNLTRTVLNVCLGADA